jgi:DMSO reductase anchor subunit
MQFDFKKFKNVPKVSTIVIIVSFFLPFFLIKCGGTTIAEVKGIDLISGMEIGKGEKAEMLSWNIFAILTLVCALLGAALAWIKSMQNKKASLIVACLGLVCLIILLINLKADVGDSDQKMITVSMGIGFYLAFLGFLVNSLFFGFGMKEDAKDALADVEPTESAASEEE